VITHWDDVEGQRREAGHIAGTWHPLTGEASVAVGMRRIVVDPGRWSTPLHEEESEEEIFYVLAGSGVSLQASLGGEPEAFEVGTGDCLVHLAGVHAHTLLAGPEGLDVLAFGERHPAYGSARLPRVGVSWGLGAWARTGDPDDHPWRLEATAGAPAVPPLSPRPSRIVNAGDVPATERAGATVARTARDLGSAAGSFRTGLKLYDVRPGAYMNAPHVHSAEEEIYVVLDGDGVLEHWPHPRAATEPERFASDRQTTAVRRGHTVAQPAGTGRALSLRAGGSGLQVLAYGTREPNDITYYPRSGKISVRGVGVIGRLAQLDYWDGED
jgi:uncharacterized cupin superfamily protein